MLRFQKRLKPAAQGFTLFEVLIAILVITLFVSVAMQAMVFAAVFKVKAQEYAEATTWIQEDLESVKYQADNLQFPQTRLSAIVTAGVSPITGVAATSFANSGKLLVGLDTTSYTFSRSANTLTITPPLVISQASGAAIIDITMCNPDPTNTNVRNLGLADRLRDTVTDTNHSDGITDISTNNNYVDNPPSSGNNQSTINAALRSKFTNQQYTLRRTTTTSANSPYNVLQLKYEVSPGTTFDSSKVIAQFDTEVIPNVAFQCP